MNYYRSTPTYEMQDGVRVNREDGIIYGLSAFQAHVVALGHGVMGDEITMAQMVMLGNSRPNGIKSRFTHPGMSEDGTGKQVAVMRNFRIRDNKVIGDAHMLESARKSPKFSNDVVDYLMTFAEESPTHMGMSVVISADAVWKSADGEEVPVDQFDGDEFEPTTDYPLLRVVKFNASDFVDEPAANRDGLFSAQIPFNGRQFSTGTSSALANDMFTYLDAFIAEQGWDAQKAYEFAMRYFNSRLGIGSDKENIPYRSTLELLAQKRP